MPRLMVRPVRRFMHQEASGGIVLLAATIAALAWANAHETSYAETWEQTTLALRLGGAELAEPLRDVVNDGLMALFFLVIGLEIKRELAVGELSDRRAALLPFAAALGGMAVPALVFLAVAGAGGEGRGWGIPMATDIAFALGVLALLSRRVPPALTVFLLGVAVIDDIGAIAVIAIFYTDTIDPAWLAGAIAGLAAVLVLNRLHVRHLVPYLLLGIAVWLCTLESGVHATIAGVALGLLAPARPFQPPAAVSAEAYRIADETADEPDHPDQDAAAWSRLAWLSRESVSPVTRGIRAFHPWTAFVILPVFALANAGIVIDGASLDAATESAVTLGILLGLVAGKTAGLTAGALLAVRLGLARLPPGVGTMHVLGVGALAGIGFTVSLFVAGLAYEDPALVSAAKIGILAGSTLAAAAGAALLLRAGRGPSGGSR